MTPISPTEYSRVPGLADALRRIGEYKDAGAWAFLIEHAGPEISRTASYLIGDRDLIMDAVQETFLLLRDHAGKFTARRWVLRVAANASISLVRNRISRRARDGRAGRYIRDLVPQTQSPEQ